MHRYLHNWTLFKRESELFFGFKSNSSLIELTTLPSLQLSNAQALVQNSFELNSTAFNLIPESSRSILGTNLSNDLFKNFSSYMVDKNLLDKFQSNFLKNNTINLPDLLTSTTESNLISESISSTITTLSNSTYLDDLTTSFSDLNLIDLNETTSNSIISSMSNSIANSIASTDLSIDLNENEFSRRVFNNVTNSLVLEFYNIDDDVFWKNIIFLILIFLFLRILAYIILVIKTNKFK